MLNAFTKVALTAVFVVVGTMATTAVAAVACLVWAWSQASDLASGALMLSTAAIVVGAFAGLFFSVVSLAVAAVTMPPTLVLVRTLKLPRPLFDCIGGGVAGLICAAAAMSMLESLARSKGGGPPGADMQLVLDVCGMLGGGMLGYLRYTVLVRKGEAPPASSLAYAP